MTGNIPTWLPELEKWEQANYDGIKGLPPEWVPQPHKKKFHSARAVLFHTVNDKKADYQEIKSLFDWLAADKKRAIVQALMNYSKDYDESLSFLVNLFKAVSLGEIEGLRMLAGEMAVVGYRSQQPRKRGGVESGQVRADKAENLKKIAVSKARYFITQGRSTHELAGLISPHVQRTTDTVRGWLQDADIVPRRNN